MKSFVQTCIWLLLLNASAIHAQELILQKQQEIVVMDPTTGKIDPNTSKNGVTLDIQPTSLDKIAYAIAQIDPNIEVTKAYDFFQGLQSPFDPNLWVYMERKQIGGAFNLIKINLLQKQQSTLLHKENPDRKEMAFKPIAWTNDPNKIYVEGIFLDSSDEHNGIWILDLASNEFKKLDIPFSYMKTPLLSPDRTQLYFLGTMDRKIDVLHGHADKIISYGIKSKQTNTVLEAKGQYLQLIGWKQQLTQKKRQQNQTKFSNLSYYLPWDAGVDLCVSRHGTPGPVGSHTNVGRCNIFGPGGHHSYPAIDFATSLSSDQNVRASASGVVSFSGISGSLTSGYGRLVIIRHSDGTRTYYAHNKVNLVSQGQTVSRGQVVAKEGTTGGSTGDHIHFEWRAAGGNASTTGRFTGIGQPRQDYRYRSNNSAGTPPPPSGDSTAPTTTVSASGGATQAGDFTANFTDNDNVGVTRRFYQALEKYGDNWYANRGNGFFNDNCNVLYSGYTIGVGNWSISNKHLRQSNTSSDNTQLSSFLSQNSGLPYLYEFAAKVESTSGPRKFGIHIMASDGSLSQRGNSYLIWFSGEDNKVRIYETVNNVLNTRAIGDAPQDNKWANYKITYSPAFGVLEIFKNNRSLLKWTDTSPIKNGSSISLRTNKTVVEFDDLKVYKFRAGNSQVITAGSAVTKDIRRRNGKVKSLVRDAAGNWSSPGNLDVTISSLSKQNNTIIDDTFLTNSVVVYPNPTDGKELRMDYHSLSKNTANISIYDMLGRKLKSAHDPYKGINARSMNLSSFIGDLQKGQYIIKVSIDHITSTVKITKQ